MDKPDTLAQLLTLYEEQRQESAEIKKMLAQQQADIKALKDGLIADKTVKGKRKKSEPQPFTVTLTDVYQELQDFKREWNIQTKVLQKFEESYSGDIQKKSKKSAEHGALLKKVEAKVDELKASQGALAGHIEVSNNYIYTCHCALETLLQNVSALYEQMRDQRICLEALIVQVRAVENAAHSIQMRLEAVPYVEIQEAPAAVTPQPSPPDGTVNPAMILPNHFN